jgi:hypothetical protein
MRTMDSPTLLRYTGKARRAVLWIGIQLFLDEGNGDGEDGNKNGYNLIGAISNQGRVL